MEHGLLYFSLALDVALEALGVTWGCTVFGAAELVLESTIDKPTSINFLSTQLNRIESMVKTPPLPRQYPLQVDIVSKYSPASLG